MLRITITDGPAEQRWILQGRLIAPWIGELETSWKESLSRHDPQRYVVGLTEVTLIDERGEKLLEAMKRAGVKFIASGVYIKARFGSDRQSMRAQVRSRSFAGVRNFCVPGKLLVARRGGTSCCTC
jgi:hypothetical protein